MALTCMAFIVLFYIFNNPFLFYFSECLAVFYLELFSLPILLLFDFVFTFDLLISMRPSSFVVFILVAITLPFLVLHLLSFLLLCFNF